MVILGPTIPFQAEGKQKRPREKCICLPSEPALKEVFLEDPLRSLHWPEFSHMTDPQGQLGDVVL